MGVRWMSLFRQRFCVWVALLALAIQLGLSFGHVHGLNGEHPAAVWTAAIDGNSSSAPQNDADHDDDYCAICAVLAMLSGAQTASAPVIAVPVLSAPIAKLSSATPIRSEPVRIAFRSRAPPQA